MNDRPIPETACNARRGCVRIGCGALAILLISALVAWRVLVIANRPPNIKISSHSVPRPNAYDDWLAAGEIAMRIKPPGPLSDTRDVSTWTLPQLKAFVDANQPVFSLFRKGLAEPYKHPPVRTIVWQHRYEYLRELARCVAGEGIHFKAAGQPGHATRCCLDVVEMGVRIPDGGAYITALVGLAVEGIGYSQLPGLLAELPYKDLLAVQTRIERIQAQRVPVSEIILEQGRRSVSVWQRILQDPSFLQSLVSPSVWHPKYGQKEFTSEPRAPRMSLREAWANVRLAFQNKQAMLEELQSYYEQLAREAEGPFYKGPPHVQPPRTVPGEMDGEIAGRMPVTLCRPPAILELLRTDCALRRYRMDLGRYPDSLSQLVPRYVKSVPIDPCGGKPLKYRAVKGGREFLLYSIGTNLKDDGGLAGNWRDPDAKSDIVEGKWYLPSTP